VLTELQAGPYTVRGISVGGVYTSLQIPQLDVLLDAGIPIRSFAAADRIFLSHTHPDHASALMSLLGLRRLIGKDTNPQVFIPADYAEELAAGLAVMSRVHHTRLEAQLVPTRPGDVHQLGHGLHVRAFATHHGISSLGYQFFHRITKLRPEFQTLPGPEIARLRESGAPGVFDTVDRLELAYATDTLSDVLHSEPTLLQSRVLILECTFLDEHRTVAEARKYMHIHLDELIAMEDRFENEAVVLMHFSQAYSPEQVHELIARRVPPRLKEKLRIFAPASGRWFG